jgi:hypothetical protein
MNFNYGFYYKEVLFVWHEKKLFQYPYFDGSKSYPLREKFFNKKRKMYRICRDWKSKKQLQSMTIVVKVKPIYLVSKHKDLPF